MFDPAWDIQREVIVASFCVAKRRSAGDALFGYQFIGSEGASVLGELDLAVAERAIAVLNESWAAGRPLSISFSAHYRTLETPAFRVRYIGLLKTIPESIRSRQSLAVYSVPDGAPRSGLQQLFRSTGPLGMPVMAEVSGLRSDLTLYEGCGVSMFLVRLGATARAAAAVLRRRQELRRFVRNCHGAGAKACLLGVASALTVNECIEAGANYVSGPAVGRRVAQPPPPCRLALKDLPAGAREHVGG